MFASRTLLVLFAVFALLLSGCDGGGGDTTGGPTGASGASGASGATGAESVGANVESLAIPASPELEGEVLGEEVAAEESRQAREAKVLEDAEAVGALLDGFWTNELLDLYEIQFDPPDRFEYYYGEEPVSCGQPLGSLAENAFYCPEEGDEHVAFDMDWFQRYLEVSPGGATTFLILAHEWGHAVQDSWEEAQPGADVWAPPAQELNADCLAGVFLSRSIDEGTIVEEVGDAEAIFAWLYEAGDSPWLQVKSHGTSEQRQAAFIDGIAQGTDYCRVNY